MFFFYRRWIPLSAEHSLTLYGPSYTVIFCDKLNQIDLKFNNKNYVVICKHWLF